MIGVLHVFSVYKFKTDSTDLRKMNLLSITLDLIPSLISFFIFAGGFYLLHSITTDASMRQVRQKICKRQ